MEKGCVVVKNSKENIRIKLGTQSTASFSHTSDQGYCNIDPGTSRIKNLPLTHRSLLKLILDTVQAEEFQKPVEFHKVIQK